MFENVEKIDLAKAEKILERSFSSVELLGQLRFTQDDYKRVCRAVRDVLKKNVENLERVPERVFFTLTVFCARYEDTSAAFWPVFLERLGLGNEVGIQAACRKRLSEAQPHLGQLHFPAEGYKYVTPILYHAVIPQGCISEMVDLLRVIGQDAGWDAVAEMEIEELEGHLPKVVSRVHATKALSRFVNSSHSRRLATKFVHDLCEAAHIHQRGEFRLQDIESLLEEHPVQREVWDALIKAGNEPRGAVSSTRALIVQPRWQWDLKARQLRLFFPRQSIVDRPRPAYFAIKKDRFAVAATQADGYWHVEPTCLIGVRTSGLDPQNVTIDLHAEDGARLRSWKIPPFNGRVMFFQLAASGSIASQIAVERGVPPGEWLVLIRKNLRMIDAQGEVQARDRWYSPRGFEEYDAMTVFLEPPVTVYVEGDRSEPLERFPVVEGRGQALRLEGRELPEADDPTGAATFTGEAPEAIVPAQSWDEIRNLQLQLRELTAGAEKESVAQLYSIQNLRHTEIAVWSETRRELRIQLSNLLPPNGAVGRFRLKLLRGLQSAQYVPIEFNLVPATRCIPAASDFAAALYSAEEPPQVEIVCPDAEGLTSRTGNVVTGMPGTCRIDWPPANQEFDASLQVGNFSLPLRWWPHILRSAIASKGSPVSWESQPPTLPLDALSFAQNIHIEGMPEAVYRIYAGEIEVESGRFDFLGRLEIPLTQFADYAKRSSIQHVPMRVFIHAGQREHQLLLMVIYKNSAGGGGITSGEPIQSLRVGQQVLHPDYGLGALEGFVETDAEGKRIRAAQFQFDRFAGVNFFIPVNRRLPVYGFRRIHFQQDANRTDHVRTFIVGERKSTEAIGK